MAKKHTKKALFTSVMSLVLCFAMLVGTTFAWFTDSVTSGNNIIKSGNLDVAMYWADGTKAVPDDYSTDWIDASTGAMFNYKLWEPGYTDVRHIKIENKGSLALKYQLMIQANGTVTELAKAIDVYYTDPAQQVASRADLNGKTKMATLEEALKAVSSTASGNLEAGESHTVTLAMKMQENAGNEYQQKEIGTDFSVILVATQLEAESDAFDSFYDSGAAWDGEIPAEMPESLVVDTEKKLISINDAAAFAYLNTLLNDGNFVANYGEKWKYSVELNCDINLFNKEWTPIILSDVVAFEGNGHTIRNLKITSGNDSVGLFGAVATNDLGYGAIKNLTIDGAYVKGGNNSGVLVGVSHGTIENVTVLNATIEANKYIGGLAGRTCHVKNCAIKNSTVVASDKTVGGLVGYCIADPGQATATGNTVENVRVTGTWNVGGMFGQAQNATVVGNTVKNVTVTSTTELPADADNTEVRAAELAARSAFEGTTFGSNTIENVNIQEQKYPEKPADVQTLLDNATDGTIITLQPGVHYGTLYIRPTAGNVDKMVCNSHPEDSFANAAEFKAHMNNGNFHHVPYYTTDLKNITIVGADGATVDGFEIASEAGTTYDHVLDENRYIVSYLNLSNLTFKNVAFTDKVNIESSLAESSIDGVTFDGCSFTTGGTAESNGQALRYYNENNDGKVKNIVVTNCSFKNCRQGVYVQNVNGVTVTNSTFDTTGHNAIGIQGSNVDLKNVVITGNTFDNIGDRVIRFDTVATGSITIQNNVATNSGDEDGEVMKATSLASGVTTSVSNNNWGEGKIVVNDELKDK